MTTTTKATMTIDELKTAVLVLTDPERVLSVYSGRPGCCCGCRGKHTYRTATREVGSERRGYKMSAAEVNDRVVAAHLRRMAALLLADASTRDVDVATDYVAIETDKRLYIAYVL